MVKDWVGMESLNEASVGANEQELKASGIQLIMSSPLWMASDFWVMI